MICLAAFVVALLVTKLVLRSESGPIYYGMFIAVYIASGYDVIKKAVKKVIKGKAMDENFLMVIASVGAFFISECTEGVAVMLFYQVGEWFQSYAVGKSRNSIKELMDIRPDCATVMVDGEEKIVDPSEVNEGDIIVIRPGEKVPLDGTIIEGSTALDTKALTGESIPREVATGDNIISGCVNLSGLVRVSVTRKYEESTVARILDLVENATERKANTENFITKFARYYTPVIVILAACVFLIPTLFLHGELRVWLYRALSFLVISCPCALVISIPLGFFGGIGGAGRAGILVKGSSYLELMAQVDTVVMDKTGTLTKGVFEVCDIITAGNYDSKYVLEMAAMAENYSNHPISLSIKKAYGGEIDAARIGQVEENAGYGVKAQIDGKNVYVGNDRYMNSIGFDPVQSGVRVDNVMGGTLCYVADDFGCLGCIIVADRIKDDAKYALESMRANGVKRIIMLTGDNDAAAKAVAELLQTDEYYSKLLPADKVTKFEEIISNNKGNGKVAFVGDGINDAPVLARADVGIAMGGLGSDAAIEAADLVIMNDEPGKIALSMKIARSTLRIVRENIVFALSVKVLILILATVGAATMWAAVFADVGVAFLAILNSLRALRVYKM